MVTPIKILEELRLSRFHYILLTITSLVYALAAMNVMLIGALLPAIQKEWKLTPSEAGYMLSFGYLGMFFGAILSGRISDKIGRKYTMILMLSIASIFTGLCGIAWDFWSMSIMRIIAGIGLGGTLPLPGVYISEYPPARYRGRFVGLVETAWVYGVILSIIFARIIMPTVGWRTVFVASYIPLLLIPFIIFYIPESIRFLEKKNKPDEIKQIFKKYGLVEDVEKIELSLGKHEETRILELFTRDYMKRTILLWVLWAVLVYTYHGIFIWLPSIYASLFQYEIVKSLEWVLIITLAQIPGYYSATFLLDKIGRKLVLEIYLTVAGVACLLLATTIDINMILMYSIVISFFNLGAWAGLYTYTPELYPTRIRGTGTGVAASIGRLAGILAPSITGYLFEVGGGSLLHAFIIFALAHIIAALSTLIIGEETKEKMLEEIAR
ncbi:MAG: MFS transporter [Aigarchaeota archaeon]|nr:MFS transporter [Candidatus Geocrenenecus dongiae]